MDTSLTTTDIYKDRYIALSNALIQAREKTSLLESKIELLTMYKANTESLMSAEKTDASGNPYDVHYIKISANEIRNLIGRKGGSIYEQIAGAALELKQKVYIYKDAETRSFTMKSLFNDVSYSDGGKLYVELNPETEHLFLELKDNFTKLRLDIAFRYTTNGGFQLYKLLKSYVFTLGEVNTDIPQEEQPYITRQYSLAELRMQLGYVDLNQPELKREGAKKNPDVEKMGNLEKKPKYKRYNDFFTRVLKPGVAEVNEISDIYISSLEKICGEHGRVEGIIIKVQHNVAYYEKEKASAPAKKQVKKVRTEDEIFDFYMQIRDIIEEKMSTKEYARLAEAADWDLSRIEKAYAAAKASSKDIDNLVAFLLTAIRENYEAPVKKKAAKKNQKAKDTSFNRFSQREYDYEDLEKQLLRAEN